MNGYSLRSPADAVEEADLSVILDMDPAACRTELQRKYAVLDAVLSGDLPAIIYPAARMGRMAARRLLERGIRVLAFGDGNPALWSARIEGLPVLSPEVIAREYPHTPILLASTLHDSILREDLAGRGCTQIVPVGYLNLRLPDVFVSREYAGAFDAVLHAGHRPAIREAYALLGDKESRRIFVAKLAYYTDFVKRRLDDIRSSGPLYFDRSIYALGRDESVVDGGAYVGDTLLDFQRACAQCYRSYYAFEPDPANFIKLAAIVKEDPARIVAVPAGLARCTGRLRFAMTSGVDARLLAAGEAGGEDLSVVGLDEFFADRPPPTIIKMDIEGAEADALMGAAGLIARVAPTLAISAYHHPADLWNVPLLMHRLNPSYRLHLRHYTREVDDTVCYALRVDGRRAA